ncbi:MAG: hypothetical protein QOE73_2024 [Verrucomicrobiota bacterium]
MINEADRPNDLGIACKIDINFFAQFRHKLFGIIQFSMAEFLRQNYGCGHNGSGQRAAPGFINPRDANDTDSAQFLFVAKSTPPIHLVKSSADFAEFHEENAGTASLSSQNSDETKLVSPAHS